MVRRALVAVTLLVAVLLSSACTAQPAGKPPASIMDVTGTWYLVKGEDAEVLKLEPDGTGTTYGAMLAALRGEAAGMGPPYYFTYTVHDGRIVLDFRDEPDVTLDVSSASPERLVVGPTSTPKWVGTWRNDFK
jgi:hypothetical protein